MSAKPHHIAITHSSSSPATTSAATSTALSAFAAIPPVSGNVYEQTEHLSPDMTRALLGAAFLLGAAGIICIKRRGWRTTLIRVWRFE